MNHFDSFFGPDYGPRTAQPKTATTTSKPLPQIRGKRVDGVLYLNADDIADALASQAPVTNRRLIDRIRRTS